MIKRFSFCKPHRSKTGLFLLPFILATFASFSQQDPLQVTQFKLDNGLTVMLSENHHSPQIFGVIAVKAGGKNDPADATGIAHYLEHMLFKGTDQLGTWNFAQEKVHLDRIKALYEELGKTSNEEARQEIQSKINEESIQAGKYAIPNEMDRMLSEIGGQNVNAFTTEDFTAYHNTFPSNKLERWLQVYDHRFENPIFRLFQSELETVYEEKNRSMDSPFSAIFEEFAKNFWRKHPYGQQTILGHTEHLKNPSLEKMYAYFKQYYVANNMVLVLSGDFDTDEAKELIKKYFSDWRRGEVPSFPDYQEADFQGNEKVTIKATPIKVLVRGYRSPSLNHPDYHKMEIVHYLLSNEEESGLLDRLSIEGKLNYAGMMPVAYNDYGSSVLFAVPKIVGQGFQDAEKLVDEQLELLKKGTFSESFFDGAKMSLIKDFERQLENNEDRALLLVNAFSSGLDWTDHLKQFEHLKQLTKADIVSAANKYYGPNYLTLYSKRGSIKHEKLNKPGFEPVIPEDGKSSKFYEEWKQTKDNKISGRFVQFDKDIDQRKLKDQVELRCVKNPFNSIFNLRISWGIGSDHDSLLFYLPTYLNKLGTEKMSATEFKQALFEKGASMNFASSAGEFFLNINGLDSEFEATMTLVQEFLRDFKNDSKAISNMAQEIKTERKFRTSEPGSLLQALSSYALYGQDSYELRQFSSKQIKKISTAELAASYDKSLQYGIQINYVGSKSGDQIQKELETLLPEFNPTKARLEHFNRTKQGFDKNRVYFTHHKKAVQSQIMFLIDGVPMNPEQMGIINAFNNYFGSDMSSLVFQEIREFRSLAYSTSAMYGLGEKPGYHNRFYAYVGCQGDKTPEALEVMYDLMQNMPAKKERIEAIRSNLISASRSAKPNFKNLIWQVDSWKKMGLTEDPNKGLLPFYQDLTFDQIVRFQQEHIKDKSIQLIVIGNKKKFDSGVFKKYGEVKQVKSKKIVRR
ncbi:MAG: insulinase family protein [Bacteroidetes bacterium]|nr:MAG: insulinase family protein [Bacteroidota bacterium]